MSNIDNLIHYGHSVNTLNDHTVEKLSVFLLVGVVAGADDYVSIHVELDATHTGGVIEVSEKG